MTYYNRSKPKALPVRRERFACNWSAYQRNIFQAIAEGQDNLIVEAVPGAGKTTTIVEGSYHVPAGKSVLFLAFSAKIAEELKSRLPVGIEARTLHSIGMEIVRNAFGKVIVDKDKTDRAIVGLLGDAKEKAEERENLRKTVSLCKGHLAYTPEEIENVTDIHGIAVADKKEFISNVIKILDLAKMQRNLIDFDDMIWFANVFNLQAPSFDYTFVDELQDLNAAQFGMLFGANGICRKGKFVGVGDRYQAIYQFRSAMPDAMDQAQKFTNAKVLPLSVSYRCAKSIVELAKAVNPGIESAENAIEGLVEECSENKMLEDSKNGDYILSRTNAPLIATCLQLIKAGKKANIAGRDVGRSLSYMIVRSEAKTVNAFITWLESWKDAEVGRLTERNKDASWVTDKYECMLAFCEGCGELSQVKSRIENCFSDTSEEGRITLSTIHKAKGLERKRAWLISKTFRANKGGEEANIYYVALTRAKESLFFVKD